MKIINIHDAKTQFFELIDAVALGEEIMIAKAGRPTAMLVPIHARKPDRAPGALKGKIRVAGDFDTPLPDALQAAFEGR